MKIFKKFPVFVDFSTSILNKFATFGGLSPPSKNPLQMYIPRLLNFCEKFDNIFKILKNNKISNKIIKIAGIH